MAIPLTAPVAPEPATVVVLGDSISRLSEPAIAGELAGGYDLVAKSRDGVTVAEQISSAALYAPGGRGRPADAMLIELGVNDTLVATSDVIGDLRRLARVVAGVPCVVWHSVIQYPNKEGVRAGRINLELQRLASTHPHFFFTDLNQPLYHRAGALSRDAIHPSEVGRRYLARVYARDLVKTCRLPPVSR